MSSCRRVSERGQGLAEYALILVLVAVVVIVVLAATGQRIGEIFCGVAVNLGAQVAINSAVCAAPTVTCSGLAGGANVSSPINVEAIAHDSKGDNTISKVDFYIDGALIRTENHVKFCLGGGDASCADQSVSAGAHTLRAVATDADNNTGECTVSFTIH